MTDEIKRLKKKRFKKRIKSKTTHTVTEDKDGVKEKYYSNVRGINKDGSGDYRATNETYDSKTGKYDYNDYYGKVDKDGSHIIKPVKVKAKKKKK